MTSQSLYRKWRSQTFNELIGQEPIIRTLKNALSSGNPAHAYLFTGPRGTGKTSTARLLAKTINCANPKDGEPCNECQQCREITVGNSFNVIEIDAASNRGIDSIRDLREKVMMPPSTGKYKVYVLDEAHMLTTEASNALLKTLEEPPDYAIFVMATTDVHKMLPTVLSRCQRFDFKRITTRQIVEHILFVAEQEHVKLERAAAELIARAAAGGMRDALSLLDQAIAYSGEEISLAQVQAMLGVADPRAISKLITSIAELRSSDLLHLIHELSEAGADLRQINAQVIEFWRALLLAKAGADIASILDLTEDEMRDVQQLAQFFSLEELTECARIFAQNDLIQKNIGTPQLALELASLESIELHRAKQSRMTTGAANRSTINQVSTTPDLSQSRPIPSQPAPQVPSPIHTEPHVTKERTESAGSSSAWNIPAHNEGQEEAVHQEVPTAGISTPDSDATSSGAPSVEQTETSSPSLTVQQVRAAWESVRKRTKQKSKSGMMAAYLGYYKIIGVEGTAEQPIIVIQAEKPAHYKYVKEENRYKDLEWALSIEFNQKCQVRLVPPDQPELTLPSHDFNTYSLNASANITPQQSAHREHPASGSSLPTDQIEQEPNVGAQFIAPATLNHPSEAGTQSNGAHIETPPAITESSSPDSSSAVAKTHIVRENSNRVQPQEPIEQKVRRDPVVQEVIKTFGAEIIEIHPK